MPERAFLGKQGSLLRMPGNQLRFHLPPENRRGAEFFSRERDFCHRLREVLRRHPGDEIRVFAEGKEWLVEIVELQRDSFRGKILQEREIPPAFPWPVKLFVGLPRHPAKLELLAEKATELGVSALAPFPAENSLPKKLTRAARLEKILLAAAEQSGRATVPQLAPAGSFQEALATARGQILLLDPKAAEAPFSSLSKKKERAVGLAVFIGPEGGFSREEISLAKAAGARIGGLGPAILKFETAGIAALAQLLGTASSDR